MYLHVRFQVLTAAGMKITAFRKMAAYGVISAWWWRQCEPLKRRSNYTILHGAIFHKAVIFNIEKPNVMVWVSPFLFYVTCVLFVSRLIVNVKMWHTLMLLCLVVTTCSLLGRYQHFGDTYCLHLHCREKLESHLIILLSS